MQFKDIKTSKELYEFMKNNIKYGFISSYDNRKYIRKEINNDTLYENMLFNTYFLQSPNELLKSKCGLCYDQTELERFWLQKNGYDVYTFFSEFHNHVFLIYKDNNKYYLFERTMPKYNGIYEATSLGDCLEIYKQIQFKVVECNMQQIIIYPYDNVPYGLNFYQFKNFATSKSNEAKILKY